jgi:hypothetical protein
MSYLADNVLHPTDRGVGAHLMLLDDGSWRRRQRASINHLPTPL